MRLANLNDRAVILESDTRCFDVHTASSGRFGPDIQGLYPVWSSFVDWAVSATGELIDVSTEGLGPVTPRPFQSFGIGLNYTAHADETGFERPEDLPPVFPKFQSSITGPYTTVRLAPQGATDWEAEMVVVIGREAHRITPGTGWDHVAGLTVGQDLSERSRQMAGPAPQFGLAKSFPGYSPQGPWLVTPDALPDRDDLEIRCELDGETVQHGRTSQMIFDVPSLVEKLAEIVTLHPGDAIYSGTPAGVGYTREPARMIRPGQRLVTTITGIGSIRQEFVA